MHDNNNQQTEIPVEAEIVEVHEPEPMDPSSLGLVLPDDPEEREAMLLTALAEARSDASDYLDDLQRVAAEFDNYRKRAQRDLGLSIDRAAERVVERILPVLDTFDAALSIDVETAAERKLLSGMIGTREQLLEALRAEGLEVIPATGEPFDPEVHEAVTASGNGGDRIMVTGELRRGYKLKGKVIRAALASR